jgi:predicted transcriptional regulator YdeE
MLVNDFPGVKIMYVKSENGINGARQAFDKLEAKLPTLKGRKFYGVVFGAPPHEEYWAGVAITETDNPKAMGLEIYEIPNGKYAQAKIKNWNSNLDLIGKTFNDLMEKNQLDESRPSIEFYRSMTELLCRIPVK